MPGGLCTQHATGRPLRRRLAWAWVVVGLLSAGVHAVWRSAWTETPRVSQVAEPTLADLERGRRIYRQLFPLWPTPAPERRLRLSAQDLDLALVGLLASRRLGFGRVQLTDHALTLDLSLRPRPEGRYLNLRLRLVPAADRLVIDRVHLGVLPLPGALVRPLVEGLLAASPLAAWLRLIEEAVREVKLVAGELRLTLAWDAQSVHALIDAAGRQLAGVDPTQLDAYRARLGELAGVRPTPDFARVMGELFALARARSQSNDPVVENRALLIALAEIANGLRLGLPGAPAHHLGGLNLAGRGDYVQHFTLSAALAAIAGEELADRAGLYKEVRDTRGGSGFSFSDLAADRAGARFGVRATATPATARQVQALLAGSRDTALYMPEIRDLPEFLPGAVLEGRYGGVGGEGYNRLLALIEQRIATLPVHRAKTD